MKLSKREKVLIIMVLIIMSALAYIFLFLTPHLDEIKEIDSQNITNEGIIQTNKVLKQRVIEITEQLAEDKKLLAEFGEGIKSTFDQPPVLVYLYETIKSRQCDKLMIYFVGSGVLGQVKYFTVTVTMKGKYDDLKNVLKDFSESDYFIKVINLSAELKVKESNEDETTDDPSFTDNFSEPEVVMDDRLDISMDLEFYYIGDEIPPDTIYDFLDGAIQYGGDIFH